MNMNKLAKIVCEREGLKQQVNISQVKEILRVLVDLIVEDCKADKYPPSPNTVFDALCSAVNKKVIPKKKAKKR